jgi:cell division septation protein DedD
LSHHTEDDGFHEIQLNGKQLVFVFMALTVVSVVIFLCGVLVGRGVQSGRAQAQNAESPAELKELGIDPARAVIPPTVQPGSDPTLAPPPAPPEGEQTKGTVAAESPASAGSTKDARLKLEYKAEEQKPALDPGRSAPADSRAPAGLPGPARAALPRAAGGSTEPAVKDGTPGVAASGPDWVVQVAAVRKRGEADAIAKRLGSKGYSTFVLAEGARVFRVRVGGYRTKREADVVAAKLRKEERINPWVTQRQAP